MKTKLIILLTALSSFSFTKISTKVATFAGVSLITENLLSQEVHRININNYYPYFIWIDTAESFKIEIPPVDYSQVQSRPALAGVATSGSYEDLSYRPDLNHLPNYYEKGTVDTMLLFRMDTINDIMTDYRAGLIIGDMENEIDSKVSLSDLTWSNVTGKPTFATVATSGNYNDLINLPNLANFITSSSLATTLSGYTTSSSLSTTLSNYATTSSLTTGLAGKQNTLVSGTSIKTVESQSVLGSGDIDLTKTDVGLSNVDNTSDATKNSATVTLTNKTISGASNTITNIAQSSVTNLTTDLAAKQPTLVSGTNIKTVGGTSILGSGDIALPTAVGTNKVASYSSGTAYNMTTTPAKITFGSNSPSVTLPTAGTYVIMSNVRIDYAGLTNLAANTVTIKLRRINNTATDLSDAAGDFVVPPVTLLTSTGGDCDVSTVFYTTTNNNDIIEIWGSRSGSVSVGNIQAGNAWIVAYRIY